MLPDPDAACALLEDRADPARAGQMAAYHKVARRYLGIPTPVLNEIATEWRRASTGDERLPLARALWASDTHEGRILAAKLLSQSRIRPDDSATWEVLKGWVPDFDGWAIADAVATAGQKRLLAMPSRLDDLEPWVRDEAMWTRRAALVFTLGFTKSRHPKPAEVAARERVLGWATGIAESRDWFLQKAVAWWLRDLSRRDPDRVRAWLETHGARLKPFTRKEAARHLDG